MSNEKRRAMLHSECVKSVNMQEFNHAKYVHIANFEFKK